MDDQIFKLYEDFVATNFSELREIPKELFHYTSLDALLGMISNEEIWMTHINFMNDKQEFRHALHIINKLTDESLAAYRIKNIDTKFAPYCTFSFSENPNLLSQWRGYCPKDIGVCLGFNPKILLKNNLSYLYKCIYDDKQKSYILQRLVNISIAESLRSQSQEETNLIMKKSDFLSYIACTTFKDKSFKEEGEWRLVSTLYNNQANTENLEKTNFRVGTKTLIPYKRKRLDIKESLSSIWIGPSSFQKETAYSIRYFLEMAQFEKSKIDNIIKLSDIPFIG